MRDNPYDKALERTLGLIDKVSDKIGRDFKGVKPFGKEPISKKKLLEFYNQLTNEDMEYFIQEHGEETVNQFIQDMEVEKLNARIPLSQ